MTTRHTDHNAAQHAAPAYATSPAPGSVPPGVPPGFDVAGQPGFSPAPPPPAKRSWFARHKILTGILALIAVVVLANLFGGGGEDRDTPAPAGATAEPATGGDPAPAEPAGEPEPEPAQEEPAAQTAGIGTPVRDGKFEFTVTGLETGVAQVGNEFLNEKAQGQFVLVHITVTNIGDQAQIFLDSNNTLVDTAGREHSANSSAGIYLEDNDVWLNEINPGNSVTGTVVFDIPADAVPASLQLRDSMFSGGVTVSLAQ